MHKLNECCRKFELCCFNRGGQSVFANAELSAAPIAAFREGANGRPVNETGLGPFPEGWSTPRVSLPFFPITHFATRHPSSKEDHAFTVCLYRTPAVLRPLRRVMINGSIVLAQKASNALTEAERQELEHLRQQNDLLMFQKAYAALLLKWRGERVPTVTELEATL